MPELGSLIAPGERIIIESAGGSAPLYASELAELRRAAYAFLKTRPEIGRDVLVPLEDVLAIEQLVRERRTVANGPVCAGPPSLEHLLVARYPHALRAGLAASCNHDGSCTVTLRLERKRPSGAFDELARWEARVSGQPITITPWKAAVARLARTPVAGKYGVGSGRRTRTSPHVEIERIVSVGSWHRSPRAADFEGIEPSIQSCLSAATALHPSGVRFDRVMFSVSPNGQISRCDAQRHDGDDDTNTYGSCLCGAIQRASFPRATGQRRLTVFVDSFAGDVQRDGRKVHVSFPDPPTKQAEHEQQPVKAQAISFARCFASAKTTSLVKVRGTLTLDARGHVVETNTQGVDDQALKRCLDAALMATKLPCPDRVPDAQTTRIKTAFNLYLDS
ncbi:MAG: hypothetical protein AB7P03_28495 [Kofleriaceae bacterium]